MYYDVTLTFARAQLAHSLMCVHAVAVRSMVRRGAADHVHGWLVTLLPSLVPSPQKKWPGNKANYLACGPAAPHKK